MSVCRQEQVSTEAEHLAATIKNSNRGQSDLTHGTSENFPIWKARKGLSKLIPQEQQELQAEKSCSKLLLAPQLSIKFIQLLVGK